MKERTPFLQQFYLSVSRYFDNELTNHAGAVAYYFLLSIIPIILVMLTIFNSVLSSHANFSDEFFNILSSFSPNLNREFLEKFGLSSGAAKAIGIIGLVNLFWTSRLILASVQRAFDVIFTSSKKRNFIITSIISIILIPVVFLLVTIFAGVRIILKLLSGFMIERGISPETIGSVGELSFTIPIVVAFLGAFFCYRYLPQQRPSSNAAFRGALLFGLLFTILRFLFGFTVNMAKMNIFYGVIGALIVLLLWVYLICQIFFICAEYTYVSDRTDMLVLNSVFAVHSHHESNFIERWLFGSKSGILRRYSDFTPQGNVFFNQGDNSDEIYYIYEGQVDIFINGSDVPLTSLKEGDIFGEMAHLLDSPRTSTAIAGTDSVVIKISPNTFKELISENSKLSMKIINSLCERLKVMNEKLYS